MQKASTLSRGEVPGADSTPTDALTAQGWMMRTQRSTFCRRQRAGEDDGGANGFEVRHQRV